MLVSNNLATARTSTRWAEGMRAALWGPFGAAILFVTAGANFLLPSLLHYWPLALPVSLFLLFLIALGLAFVIASSWAALYGVLEGNFWWPQAIYSLFVYRHRRIKHHLLFVLDDLPNLQSRQAEKIRRRLSEYPDGDENVAPTRFGNAVQTASAVYSDISGFKDPAAWIEFRSRLPAALRRELRNAQIMSDFSVAAFYLSILYALCALVLAGYHSYLLYRPFTGYFYPPTDFVFQGVLVLIIVPPVTYHWAANATVHWINAALATISYAKKIQDGRRDRRNEQVKSDASNMQPTFRDLHIHMPQGQIGQFNLAESVSNIQSKINAVGQTREGTQVAQALKALTDAALADESIEADARRDIVEHYEDLAEAANEPPHERRMSRIRSIVRVMPTLLEGATKAMDAWNEHGEAIKQFFGLR